jgi:3-dehydroquinate dehydratase-2
MKFEIINGPNLNLLGSREPGIYGTAGFEVLMARLERLFPAVSISCSQSNVEGEIVNMVQSAGEHCEGLIINPGGYTHTSVAIADAIAAIKIPVIEVHISNLLTREEFMHTTLTVRYSR